MIRRFKLVNGSGAEWNLMRFDAFFHAPDGLGFSKTIRSLRTGYDYIETDAYINQQTITGEMVFENYAVYRAFADFASVGPMTIYYAPLATWYSRECTVQQLGKTEIGPQNRIISQIAFICSGLWHETVSAETELGDIDSPKTYPYGYNYRYFDSRLGEIAIENGQVDSPIILHVYGPVTNPTWSLAQGGTVVGAGAVTAAISDGNQLVVDARPDRMEIAEYTAAGVYVRDLYASSDFSTARFLYAPPGDSVLSVSGSGGVTLIGKNKFQIDATDAEINSVQYEINDDGSVTADGTASPSASVYNIGTFTFEANKTYILTGTPAGGGTSSYFIRAHGPGATDYTINLRDPGGGVEITRTADTTLYIQLAVVSGKTVDNDTFFPMIREAGTPENYEPYREISVIRAIAEVEKNAYTV